MKKHIPNSITLLNLCSGIIAIIIALNNKLEMAAIMVIIASLFDFCDGFVARLLHVKSDIGKELDSLSDIISFGVAPGIIMYQLYVTSGNFALNQIGINVFALLFPILYACFSALRLAKFNLDTRQTENFIGLPTPAGAYVLISLPFFPTFAYSIIVFSCLIILLCYLMVSNLPLFSLKFKNLKLKENIFRYILLFVSAVSIFIIQFKAIPFIILLYIVLSIIGFYHNKLKIKKV